MSDGALLPEGWRRLGPRPWRARPVDERTALAIAQRTGVPEVVGRILAGRGIAPAEAPAWLAPRLRDWLGDPSALLDLSTAADRLAAAVEDGEPVGILADYDVDGATSAALAVRWLRGFGQEPPVEIPCRLEDGYGPNEAALDRLAEQGCRLVLCLDAGTTAFAALGHAAAQGQEVIVVDHHAAQDRLPAAAALVNPHRRDQDDNPYRTLCAAGLTFLLLAWTNRALRARGRVDAARLPDPMQWLDLVALGTVCDVVPLHGLNRAFVHQGLKVLAGSLNPGLAALGAIAGVAGTPDARRLGYQLGPRINAGGRIGEPTLGVRLLAEEDGREAQAIAARLDQLNAERRRIESEVAAEALRAAEEASDAPVVVVGGEGWHAGVIGIVASRIVERFGKPAIVVAVDEHGQGKGSGRSVSGFDLGSAVQAALAEGILAKAGGHAMAAGLTVEPSQLDELRRFLAERAQALVAERAETGPPPLEIDAVVSADGADLELARVLDQVAPYGAGNEEPRLVVAHARIVEARPVGTDHVACTLAGPGGRRVRGIAFRSAATELGSVLRGSQGREITLAGRLHVDRWQGQERANLEIDDVAVPG